MLGLLISPYLLFCDKTTTPTLNESNKLGPAVYDALSSQHLAFFENGIVTTNIQNKKTAAEILNCVILSMKLLAVGDVPIETVSERELDDFDIRGNQILYCPQHEFRSIFTYHPPYRNELDKYTMPFRKISKGNLQIISNLAYEVFQSDYKHAMAMFLESWDNHGVGTPTKQFINSWIALEVYIVRLSDLVLGAKTYKKDGKTPKDIGKLIEESKKIIVLPARIWLCQMDS